MKIRKFLLLLVTILCMIAIVGCSVSIDEEISQTKKQVEEVFNSKPLKPNKKADLFSYNLPGGFKVDKETNNNVILHQGKQTFILFVNPHEQPSSQLIYKTIEKNSNKNVLNTTFTSKDRFGYVSVKKVDDKIFELSVGIGGVKMTTETKASSIAKDAEEMMKIVSSVKINK